MQLTDIRTAVRTHYGLADSDALATDTVLTALINSSLRRIATEQDWPWLEAVSTKTVTPLDNDITDTDVRRMLYIEHDDGARIPHLNRRSTTKYRGTATGKPCVFTEFASTFTVYPLPDKDYVLTYGYILDTEPTLVGDTDEPLLPNRAIELLISDVCLLVSRRKSEERREGIFYSERQKYINQVKEDLVRTYEGQRPHHTT